MNSAQVTPEAIEDQFSDAALEALAVEASREAIADLLEHGVSVHYDENGIFVREYPDGRRFEIEYTAPRRDAVRIIRELPKRS
jgi:hypothetical protein